MIQTIKVAFKVKIVETFYDGFRGINPNRRGIFKGTNIIRDTVVLEDHHYKKKNIVNVTLELQDKYEKDENKFNSKKFCIRVFQIATNGVYTKTYVENEHPFKSGLFFESRGMITSPALKNNPFEKGDLLKVTIRTI